MLNISFSPTSGLQKIVKYLGKLKEQIGEIWQVGTYSISGHHQGCMHRDLFSKQTSFLMFILFSNKSTNNVK